MSYDFPDTQPAYPKPPKKKAKWYWNVLWAVLLLWMFGGVNVLLLQDIPLLLFLLGSGFAIIYPLETWFNLRERRGREKNILALAGMAWVLFVFAVTFALLMFVIPPFGISPKTTYLTEPLSTEFYGIDYQSVIERQLDPGVPPEENGFRLLTETFGRPFFECKDEHWQRICEYLDLPTDIEPALTFTAWRDYEKTLEPEEQEIVKTSHAEMIRPWSEEAMPIVKRWLDENNAALDLFIAASQKPVLYVPPMFARPLFAETILINEYVSRKMARELQVRVRYRLAIGEIDKAWDDVLTIYRLAEHHRRAVWNVMSSLVNVSTCGIANQSAESVLLHSGWGADEILRKAEEIVLFQRPFHEDEIRFMFRSERLLSLDNWQHFSLIEEGDAPPIFWERLKKRGMDVSMRRGYAMVETNRQFDEREREFFSGMPMRNDEIGKHDFWMIILWHGKIAGIPILCGQMMCELQIPALEAWGAALTRSQVEATLTRLMFALAAYHRDNGEYPEALDDLLGRYIDEIPLDPFSGESFRYILEPPGYLLYSVGANGIDEGGRNQADKPRGDDIRRRVPL